MINSSNLEQLNDNLQDILDTEQNLVPILGKLQGSERAKICSLIYRWSRGEEVKQDIRKILNGNRVKNTYNSQTNAWLNIKMSQLKQNETTRKTTSDSK